MPAMSRLYWYGWGTAFAKSTAVYRNSNNEDSTRLDGAITKLTNSWHFQYNTSGIYSSDLIATQDLTNISKITAMYQDNDTSTYGTYKQSLDVSNITGNKYIHVMWYGYQGTLV